VVVPRYFSFGTWHNRQHGVLRITSASHAGLSEDMLSANEPQGDLLEQGQCFRQLGGLPIGEALSRSYAQEFVFPGGRRELAEIALVDLAGRVQGRPSLELLGLRTAGAVAGTPTILTDQIEQLRQEAKGQRSQGFTTHLKIKLFGKLELDLSLVRAAREAIGPGPYLSGDVNSGYGTLVSGEDPAALVRILDQMYAAGLSGCEDPAQMPVATWVEVQRQLPGLDLIPDVVLRPAIDAVASVTSGMGRKFNLHPGCTGSFLHALRLCSRIQELGATLVIGDNSLIGPACAFWQQLAIGYDADWCEAMEKPAESSRFLECITHHPLSSGEGGRRVLSAIAPGFGIQVDDGRLRAQADRYVQIFP
jgi:L-alanine-DL-glutamate epimerase-like enolase superfamily enzyme